MNYYYVSLGMEYDGNYNGGNGTKIILYVKDESGKNTSIPDEGLQVSYRLRWSTNSQSYEDKIGQKSNGAIVGFIQQVQGYALDEIKFASTLSDGGELDEISDDGLTARIGNNIYEIVDSEVLTPIEINICAEPKRMNCTASGVPNCYRGSSLNGLNFKSDEPLPKNIDISVNLTYRSQDPDLGVTYEEGCSYVEEPITTVYTMTSGTTSITNPDQHFPFNRYTRMCESLYGYKRYFDTNFDYNFTDTSSKSYSFTLNGQQYDLTLSNCGTPPSPTPVDGECGTSYTSASLRCSAGTSSGYNSTLKTRKCVGENGGDTVNCSYVCTTTTVGGTPYSCPEGYELDGTSCKFVGYRYCGYELCKCDGGGAGLHTQCACINGEMSGDKGSNWCFGDASQASPGTLGVWPTSFDVFTSPSYYGYLFGGYNGDYVYGFKQFEDESLMCASDGRTLDYLIANCSLVKGNSSNYDNGYYLTNCNGVPSTVDACGGGGTTTQTCEVKTTSAGSSCFPAGTEIVLEDGSKKSIEDVQPGDMVLTYNESTHIFEPNEVVESVVHPDSTDEMYELTIDGEILKVTYSHKFYVASPTESIEKLQCNMVYNWIAAQDLKVGDLLLMSNGEYNEIDFISHHPNVETVYTLSVANNHNYFVGNGYLVHNKIIHQDLENDLILNP